jgi:hypothetical protein
MWGRRRGADLLDTAEMDAFFARLNRMNEVHLLGLRAAWQAIDRREHEDAWTAVRVVGASQGLAREIDRVRKKAIGWTTRGSSTVPYNRMFDNEGWQQVKMEAGEAIVDAALAVALAGRLDAHSREILIGPWEQVTEPAD